MRLGYLAAALSAVGLAAAGCGGFEINEFPRIEVSVEDEPIAQSGTEVQFTTALQSSIDMEVRVTNPGNATLEVTRVGWKVDEETGLTPKNEYVELTGGPIGGATVEPNDNFGLAFKIRYTPPVGKSLDDFQDSVLIIESNARDLGNKNDVGEYVLTFTMPEDRAYPQVSPSAYTFQNATPAKPETQRFFIDNDPELATIGFQVTGIRLAKSSDEFKLLNLPNLPAEVLGPKDPMYQPVTVDVQYRPVDTGNDTNTLIVETSQGTYNIPLTSNLIRGGISISGFSHNDQFDFSNVTATESRRVSIRSEGPGVLTIQKPRIDPVDARDVFTVKAFLPATQPGQEPTEITNFPRALTAEKTIELEVTYSPNPSDPTKSPNGQLVVPYSTPDNGELVIDLWAGTPKPLVVIAPLTKLVAVNAPADGGATGERQVVVYNHGNGDLVIEDVTTEGSTKAENRVFELLDKPEPDAVVPPGGMLVISLGWSADRYAPTNLSEFLHVHYVHGFTGELTKETVGLLFEPTDATLPVANAGEDVSGVVKTEVVLDGSASTPGDFSFTPNSFLWYLTSAPAGSNARLNVEEGAFVGFTPDVPGTYTAQLVVYSVEDGSSDFLTSHADEVTIDAQAAP